MKAFTLTLALLVLLAVPAFAEETSKGDYPVPGGSLHSTAIREHIHTVTDHPAQTVLPDHIENYEKYDYGAFLDVLYSLNKNVDVGVKTSYEHKRNEYTALVGAVIKFGPKEK